MGLFRKSKESIEQVQEQIQPSIKEGIDLSEQEKQQIIQKITEIDQRIEEIKLIRTDEEQWNKLEDAEAQKLFDEYNTIKNEKERLQRKLEGKPENTIITAEDKEGKEIIFDLEQIKQQAIDFFKQHNLEEIAEELEQTNIELTGEQIQRIIELAEQEDFDKMMLFPTVETQQKYLQQFNKETHTEIKGLKGNNQYSKDRMYWGPADSDFPNHIQTNNRPKNKPYFLCLKNQAQVDADTAGKTPQTLREEFKQKQLHGLTLSEYLIFQRDYTQKNTNEQQPHPDDYSGDGKATWLLDSELDKQSSGPGQVLCADWNPGHRRVVVSSNPASASNSRIGARSSAIFEIL